MAFIKRSIVSEHAILGHAVWNTLTLFDVVRKSWMRVRFQGWSQSNMNYHSVNISYKCLLNNSLFLCLSLYRLETETAQWCLWILCAAEYGWWSNPEYSEIRLWHTISGINIHIFIPAQLPHKCIASKCKTLHILTGN